ncbi:hypothetical protein FA13DRAFT_1452971 [Coprinellus micaceus]|uniref:Uncharacterized protein n=1 Tax=Coprinellus micaceus TaxID=71717 RepID=A0A4Y7SNM5_COPMI|nr:hypothetical protein FA13DRAFT_1452971 [Coprinellus micaceus]
MAAHSQVSGTSKLATFSDLPNELLAKILCQEDEPKTKRRLLELRWVSRAVDEVIGHRVVEYLKLPKDAQQVEAMLASGPSSFDTATRTLHIEVRHYDPGDSTKWQALTFLIERMKGIQAIRS